MKELASNTYLVKASSHSQKTTTGQGDIIDTQGFDSVMFAVLTAATTASSSHKLDFSVQEGDEAGGGDMVTVTDADRILGSDLSIDDSADDNVVRKIGIVLGTKRYVRLQWTATGSPDSYFGAVAVLGHPRHAPVDAQ